MKKIKLILSLILIVLLVSIVASLSRNVEAQSPYKTYTVDRYGELVETQDAYDPVSSIAISYNGVAVKGAQDMTMDEYDNLYIADTDNKRGLILDKDLNVVTSFGDNDGVDSLYRPTGIYVLDSPVNMVKYIYVCDYMVLTNEDSTITNLGRILRYTYNVETKVVSLERIFNKPSSWILESESAFKYEPTKIAVSANYYMYVVVNGSTSGILMITPENEFITYFASNSADYTLWESILYFLYGDNPNADLEKKIATAPYNVMLDGSGYIYTVTYKSSSTEIYEEDFFKKVNTGGINYFPDEMIVKENLVDSYYGKYSNTYALSQDGFIMEYDNEGNLLFMFGGKGADLYGLFSSASTITVSSKDYIYVMDNTRNNLQVFKPTVYTNLVHEALSLYTDAKYEEALDIWNEVLRYNSMFDLAHKGVGLAYYMKGDYEAALDEFYIANDKADYSDAYWEIRNLYLIDNLSTILIIVVLVIALIIVVAVLNKRYHFMKRYVLYPFIKLNEIKFINQTSYMIHFIDKPSNTIYEIKTRKRATVLSSSVILLAIFVEYILGLVYTGFYFNETVIENTILLNEGIKILLPIILFIFANYLMSSLMDGEGKFKDIYIASIGSLMPILILYPFIILVSNVLTESESFLYGFLLVVMFIWAFMLLFMNIKEVHNYSVSQTIVNLLLTVFMLVILILVILIIYVMGYQIVTFIEDIVKEAIINA